MAKFIPFFIVVFLSISAVGSAQVSSSTSTSNQEIVLDPVKVAKFEKYCIWKHDLETGGFIQWKANNPDLYLKEMWYYTESFYVKRNQLNDGITLTEASIDISRFEVKRKDAIETTITLPGFKDVIVLIPGNQLIYKLK